MDSIPSSGFQGRALKLFEKKGRVRAHIAFLNWCKKNGVVPKGFFSKPLVSSRKADWLEKCFARHRMIDSLRANHGKLALVSSELDRLCLELNLGPEALRKAQENSGI